MAADVTCQSITMKVFFKFFVFILIIFPVHSLPDQGKWSYNFTNSGSPEHIGIAKSLYNQSKISIKITCSENFDDGTDSVEISWVVRKTPCYEEYVNIGVQSNDILNEYYDHPLDSRLSYQYNVVHYIKSKVYTIQKCSHGSNLEVPIVTKWLDEKVIDVKNSTNHIVQSGNGPQPIEIAKREKHSNENSTSTVKPVVTTTPKPNTMDKIVPPSGKARDPQVIIDRDGVYLLVLLIAFPQSQKKTFSATVDISMECPTGYLSAVDWPLLPFYGIMCIIYVIYGIAWLLVSACQWRDLIRIQFWIGGVIVLGMLEKAVFYAEYQSINSTGSSVVERAVIFAELVSCCKRTLARMLVIIVSLGFGIVKPRLGPMLHRVVGIGSLYFILASVEGCSRVLKTKNDTSNQFLMASIPLAVLDSAICWWVFSSLVQTTRTLRLRRNVVKLSLYRHFTNTLLFSVLASVAFMIWSIRSHRLADCLTDWKELWIDEAYWHLLFSVILLVIMILWRPNNNNQRFAFTPLLDAVDDDDEEDDMTPINDAFGMTMRGTKYQVNSSQKKKEDRIDDDLKWVEENIPSSLADTALPTLVDSEEEIMTTKFELSKME